MTDKVKYTLKELPVTLREHWIIDKVKKEWHHNHSMMDIHILLVHDYAALMILFDTYSHINQDMLNDLYKIIGVDKDRIYCSISPAVVYHEYEKTGKNRSMINIQSISKYFELPHQTRLKEKAEDVRAIF